MFLEESMEKFKQIKEYENYSVSNYGRIRNDKTDRILKPQKDHGGYLHVALCKNGVCKTHSIHRLVALAFIDNPENKRTVNHLDGIKTNNFDSNLEWATDKENIHHSWDNGLNKVPCLKGSKHGMAKLTEDQVLEIRKLYATGDYTQTALAKMFGVSQDLISRIVNRKIWVHI